MSQDGDGSKVSDELRELALLYSIGALEPDRARVFEEWLRAGDETAAAEVRAFQEAAAQLACSLPAENPSPELRDRLLTRVRQIGFTEPLPGVHVLRASEHGWRKTPFPGVTYKQLYFDAATSMQTSLLRMDRGARYPAHRHAAVEQCLVLEGECAIGQLTLAEGDYERADAETRHDVITTDRGCLLLIIASRHDEFLAEA